MAKRKHSTGIDDSLIEKHAKAMEELDKQGIAGASLDDFFGAPDDSDELPPQPESEPENLEEIIKYSPLKEKTKAQLRKDMQAFEERLSEASKKRKQTGELSGMLVAQAANPRPRRLEEQTGLKFEKLDDLLEYKDTVSAEYNALQQEEKDLKQHILEHHTELMSRR